MNSEEKNAQGSPSLFSLVVTPSPKTLLEQELLTVGISSPFSMICTNSLLLGEPD